MTKKDPEKEKEAKTFKWTLASVFTAHILALILIAGCSQHEEKGLSQPFASPPRELRPAGTAGPPAPPPSSVAEEKSEQKPAKLASPSPTPASSPTPVPRRSGTGERMIAKEIPSSPATEKKKGIAEKKNPQSTPNKRAVSKSEKKERR